MKSNKLLRVLRAEHGLSQQDTAIKLKIGRYRYWQIENGYIDPTDDELVGLGRIFKVQPDALFAKAG